MKAERPRKKAPGRQIHADDRRRELVQTTAPQGTLERLDQINVALELPICEGGRPGRGTPAFVAAGVLLRIQRHFRCKTIDELHDALDRLGIARCSLPGDEIDPPARDVPQP